MKLLTKTSLLYLLFAVPVMVLSSLISFQLIHSEVIESTDESLMRDFFRLKTKFLKNDSILNFNSFNGEVSIKPSLKPYAKTCFSYSDTTMYDEYEDEMLPFRMLKIKYHSTLHDYNIIIRKMYLESDELMDGIIYSLSVLFSLLLVGFLLINFFVSKNLWKPFYKTLTLLVNFDLHKKKSIQFDMVSTQEFKNLNTALNQMTQKIQNDYQNLKEFTENASHEIQTPLAIIRSKLELMIQAENIPAEQQNLIHDISESTNRLSKLNQSLLLLAKIENQQFHEIQTVDLKKLTEDKLKLFEDMIAFKNIAIEKQLARIEIKINPYLADILFSNIIGNAIKHNINTGRIFIQLRDNLLAISNTGQPLTIPPEKLFKRFQKANPSSDSAGLGLAIVKQICNTYKIRIEYVYKDETHFISLRF